MGRPGAFWTDLLILAAWCQPKKERFSIAVPHQFRRRLLMTATASGAQFQTASTTSVCCQWDGIPPVPLWFPNVSFQVVGIVSDLDGDEVSLQYFKDKHLLSTRSSFPLRGFQLIQDDLLKEISSHIHPHQISFPSLLNVHTGPAALMLHYWGIYKMWYFFPARKHKQTIYYDNYWNWFTSHEKIRQQLLPWKCLTMV